MIAPLVTNPKTAENSNGNMICFCTCVKFQGADADVPSLAGIPFVGSYPGLQFTTAGIISRPSQYYRVPVLRTTLDFVVYLVMLTIFSFFVLVQSNGEPRYGEIVFLVSFVVVGTTDKNVFINNGLLLLLVEAGLASSSAHLGVGNRKPYGRELRIFFQNFVKMPSSPHMIVSIYEKLGIIREIRKGILS